MILKRVRQRKMINHPAASQNLPQAPVLTLREGWVLDKLNALPGCSERVEAQSSEAVQSWFVGELEKEHSAEFRAQFLDGLRELARNEMAMEVIYRYMEIIDSEKHFMNAQRKYQNWWLEFVTPDQLRQLVKKICTEKNWFVETNEEELHHAS